MTSPLRGTMRDSVRILLLAFLAGLLVASLATAGGPVSVKVMTFNIRYGLADDGDNAWPRRRELVFEIMQGDWDFIGLQEALVFQIDEISAALPDYGVLYRTREADPEKGEACAILFRRSRWQLDESHYGTFWLSETPEIPASKSWDSSLPRVATWGLFHSEAVDLVVANTHFDHRGEVARLESARLLRRRLVDSAGETPFVLLGDFNAAEDSAPVEHLLAGSDPQWIEAWRTAHPSKSQAGTFGGWQGTADGPKIDHIFVPLEVAVGDAEIVRWSVDGRYPSDHYPVTSTLGVPLRSNSDEDAATHGDLLGLAIEITDLGACRGCANSIVKALLRVAGVIEARLHDSEPRIDVIVNRADRPEEAELRTAVRDVGYTAGLIQED